MTATRTRDRTPSPRGPRVVRSQVEPRIVERRRQVAEADHRRRRRILAIVVGVVVLIAAAIGALYSPLLDVDRVRVEGVGEERGAELAALAGIDLGAPMIGVDLAEARAALRSVPGVRSARVSLEWPATVVVAVTEEVPAVRMQSGEGRWVVSETGRMLDPSTVDGTDDLPTLVVEGEAVDAEAGDAGARREVSPRVLSAVLSLHRMNGQVRPQVASARLSAQGDLTLELTDGAEVRVGALEDLPQKLAAAESALAQVDPECRRAIDVREPSRVTVSRGCGAAESDDGTSGDSSEATPDDGAEGASAGTVDAEAPG